MRFAPSNAKRARAAFTLAEVLAALLFMAIVIPVALEGLRIASLAAQVGERKTVAARVAERVLNEQGLSSPGPATGGSTSSGTITEGPHEYRWSIEAAQWTEGTLQLVTVKVTYQVQGRDYEVTVSTLANSATL